MIQTKNQFTIESDDNIVSVKYSIADENLATVFGILRNNIYSDKILAVIREYSTNAHDAHVDSGQPNLPIHVTLPTIFDPIFVVRDFGKGLTEYEVFNIFSSYGASTKRNTNNQIGMLGMGSKSGFSYANSFTIMSWNGGMKKTYEAFIDESEVGTIAKVGEEASSEPSGLSITITVAKNDIFTFQSKAESFYRWFSPTPVFFGNDIAEAVGRNALSRKEVVYQSCSCTIYKEVSYYTNTTIYVRMGNTCYKLDSFDGINVEWLKGYSLVINAQIGEVTFTTSRESLELGDLTLATVNRYLASIEDDFVASCQSDLDNCPSPYEAIRFFKAMPEIKQKVVANKLSWNGVGLDLKFLDGLTFCGFSVQLQKWVLASDRPWKYEDSAIIYNDGGFPSSHTKNRLLEARTKLIQNGHSHIFYFNDSVEMTKALMAIPELDGLNCVLLSSLSAKATKSKSVTIKEKVFKWNGCTAHPYSNCWQPCTPEDDKRYVYVEVRNFVPHMSMSLGDNKTAWSRIEKLKEYFEKLTDGGFELIGVKKDQVDKLPSNWVSLENYVMDKVDEILSLPEFKKKYMSNSVSGKIDKNSFTVSLFSHMFDSHVNEIHCPSMKNLVDFCMTHKNDNYLYQYNFVEFAATYLLVKSSYRNFINNVELELTSKYDSFVSDVEHCKTAYPLILGFDRGGYSSSCIPRYLVPEIVKYINNSYALGSV